MDFSAALHQIRAYANRRNLPIIPITAKNITLINEPIQFYNQILRGIKSSNSRLALSALYLGTGTREQAIAREICEKISSQPEVDVTIAMDSNRARRLNSSGQSSITTLAKVLTHSNVKLQLIDSSRYLVSCPNLYPKLRKFSEILSTYHAKMMIFDNDVMITGANLSDIYFDKRKDRYMLIRDARSLSSYLFNLLNIIGEHHDDLKTTLKSYNLVHKAQETDHLDQDTYIIPLVQCGSLGISDKEDFIEFLGSIVPEDAQIYMSAGYFNPSQTINRLKINSVLAPSEEANGFYQGAGLLHHVPRMYSIIYKQYVTSHPYCELRLFNKTGWSFHAKGLWIEGLKDYYIHLIGSSNFNRRSSSRDLEIQFVLLTKSKDLIENLDKERVNLWNESCSGNSTVRARFSPLLMLFCNILKSFL